MDNNLKNRIFLMCLGAVVAVLGAVAAIGCLGLEPPIPSGTLIVNLVVGYFFWLFGMLVVWHGRAERDVLLFYAMAMTLSLVILIYRPENALGLGEAGRIAGAVLSHGLYPLTVTLLLHFSIYFPNGAPAWARRLVPFIYLASASLSAWLAWSMLSGRHTGDLSYASAMRALRLYLPVVFFASPAIWIARLRRTRDSVTKKKLKWLLWGMAVGIGPHLLLFELPQGLGQGPLLPEELTETFSIIAGASVLIAVARYRLLDIDTVISRSIVYIVLSAVVAVAYLSLVAAGDTLILESRAGSYTLVRLPVVLLLALAFAPARRMAEDAVDRLFFRKRRDQRQALIELSRTAARTLDMRRLAGHIAKVVEDAVGVQALALYALDDTRLRQIWPESGEEMSTLDASLLEALPEGVSVFQPGEKCPIEGMRLLVPLRAEEKPAGLLAVGEKKSGEQFSDDELRFLDAVAAQTALAFSTALAFEQLRRQKEELEQRVYERTMQLSQANDRLVEQYQKLQRLDELKETMAHMVVHDLRNPITTIAVAAELAVSELDEGNCTEEVRQSLELIKETSWHLNDMAQSMLDVARIEEGTLEVRHEDFDLTGLLSSCANRMRVLAGTRHLKVQLNADPHLESRMDRQLME
ncbi:MAG: hypothetical protein D6806_00505, partial [Deltaproteobacteria bacterium]